MRMRVEATLFDKLVADSTQGIAAQSAALIGDIAPACPGLLTVPRIERFNEAALRITLLRELDWLLNTVNLEAVQDLSPFPEVRRSTLNYGLGDLSGTLLTGSGVQARARDIREAILRFEPRVERGSLDVDASLEDARPNSVSFVIRGDVRAAVQAMPVEIRTDVEVDAGTASFREA